MRQKKKKCLARDIKSCFKNSIICKQRDNSNYAASIDVDRRVISQDQPTIMKSTAHVTIVSYTELHKLDLKRANLRKKHKTLKGLSSQTLNCIGYIITKFQWGQKSTEK